MSTKYFVLAGAAMLVLASTTLAADTSAKDSKPDGSPGWVVVEEDWFFPLRFESVVALNDARFHYRRNEEKAAANEIDKAVSWLKYAKSHAMPITKEKLTTAVKELTSLSKDLRAGKTFAAAKLDQSLARASLALAEWHYFKAKEHYGKNEEGYAAQELEAAASHLQHAADSAHFQYGPDTVAIFDYVYKDGKLVSHGKTVDHNGLGEHLQSVENAVKKMGEALKKAS